MIIHKLKPRSPEWHALRSTTDNASEAPAVMGVSLYVTRSALIRQKATGIIPEITPEQQIRFDRGHKTELMARPLAEAIIGEDLFELVATDDEVKKLASSDGATEPVMSGDTIRCKKGYEHKLWNTEIAAQVEKGFVPESHKWQLVHQQDVFGFDEILFVVSDGTKDNFVYCWFTATPEEISTLRAAWAQFHEDVANYQPEVTEAKPILHANPIDNLPALFIEVTGRVTASNLVEFKAAATAVISSIKTELVTDQDFVDATAAVKYLKDVEDSAKRAKQNALDQTTSIAELHRALDEVATMAATVRKALDKKITEEKDSRKAEIVREAQLAFNDHYAALVERVGHGFSVAYVSFAESIKGLKSLDSMRDKVSVALANAKIEANAIADRIDANRKAMAGNEELMPDFAQVCTKAPDDFAALVAMRVSQQKERDEKRLEAEREKIRKEVEEDAARVASVQASVADAIKTGTGFQKVTAGESGVSVQHIPASQVFDTGKTIKLGEINAMLAPVSVNADGLALLGIHPVAHEKNAKLYSADKFPTICRLISEHVMAQAFKKAA